VAHCMRYSGPLYAISTILEFPRLDLSTLIKNMQIFAQKILFRASHIGGIARPADANGYDNNNNNKYYYYYYYYVIRIT